MLRVSTPVRFTSSPPIRTVLRRCGLEEVTAVDFAKVSWTDAGREPPLLDEISKSAVTVLSARWRSDAVADTATTVRPVTMDSPIIRAEAVEAVRRGLRRALRGPACPGHRSGAGGARPGRWPGRRAPGSPR